MLHDYFFVVTSQEMMTYIWDCNFNLLGMDPHFCKCSWAYKLVGELV
jgi:hypothetical protein